MTCHGTNKKINGYYTVSMASVSYGYLLNELNEAPRNTNAMPSRFVHV